MFYLATLLLILFLFNYIKTKSILDALNIYIIYWTSLLVISFFNPADLYTVSTLTYSIILTSVISFSFGYLLITRKPTRRYVGIFFIHQKMFLIISTILLFFLSFYMIKYFSILRDVNIEQAREIRFSIGYLFSNYLEYIFFNYIITSILYLSLIYSISHYIIIKKINLVIVLNTVNLILYAFIGLGRFIIFDTILFFVLGYILSKANNDKERKAYTFINPGRLRSINTKYVLLVFVFISIMITITAIRTGGQITSIGEYIYWARYLINQGTIYFIGPFRTLDFFIKSNITTEVGYTLGKSTISGLGEILSNFSLLFGIDNINANSILSRITDTNRIIGENGIAINAFFTGIMNFYLDGGLIFVIFISSILGSLVAFFKNIYMFKSDIINLSLLIIIFKSSLSYSYRWDFSSPLIWFIILYLFLLRISTKIAKKDTIK